MVSISEAAEDSHLCHLPGAWYLASLNVSGFHCHGDRAVALTASYWMPSTQWVSFYSSQAEAERWQARGNMHRGHCLQGSLWALR